MLLAGLGIMWVAFLVPTSRRKHSPKASVHDFERRMGLLAQTETQGSSGRWIVTPRKGIPFVGTAERKRARARDRRRTVFAFLCESIGITFLIGIVPPLRAVWMLTAGLAGLMVLYIWLLLAMKHHWANAAPHARPQAPEAVAHRVTPRAAPERFVAEGRNVRARSTFNGLGALGDGDPVHVVVRPAGVAGV